MNSNINITTILPSINRNNHYRNSFLNRLNRLNSSNDIFNISDLSDIVSSDDDDDISNISHNSIFDVRSRCIVRSALNFAWFLTND